MTEIVLTAYNNNDNIDSYWGPLRVLGRSIPISTRINKYIGHIALKPHTTVAKISTISILYVDPSCSHTIVDALKAICCTCFVYGTYIDGNAHSVYSGKKL